MNYMMTKVILYMIDFPCQIKILLLDKYKIFKIKGFSMLFCSLKFKINKINFDLNSQSLGF